MNNHAADANGVSHLDNAAGRILKKGTTKTLAMVGTGDRQAGQHDNRDRVRLVASEPAWRGLDTGVGV